MRDPATGQPLGTWQASQLKNGAGGYVSGVDINSVGTELTRTDTYNGYIKEIGGKRRELLTATNAPYPVSSPEGSIGIFEARFAPSDNDRIYAIERGAFYRSDNRGVSFTMPAAFVPCIANSNDIRQQGANGSPRLAGPKLAVDPANVDVVYIGTQVDGLRRTTDGGGNFATVSGVPAAVETNDVPHATLIAFNPASAVVGSGAAARTQEIIVLLDGTGGFRSTNGGTSFAASTGAPTAAQHLVCGSDGTFYAADRTTTIKICVNGTWSALTACSVPIHAVTTDPADPNHLIAISESGCNLHQSFNKGSTWTFFDPGGTGSNGCTATRIPWQALGLGIDAGDIKINPVNGKTHLSRGLGVLLAALPTTYGAVGWQDDSVGIENLASNGVVALPNGRLHTWSWDRMVFSFDSANIQYPAIYGPVISINHGWDMEYAAFDANYIVTVVNSFGDRSGYSEDSGRPGSWKLFQTTPPYDPQKHLGGNIAIGSTKDVIMLLLSNDGPLLRSTDRGATWSAPVSVGSVPDTTAGYDTRGWHHSYYLTRKSLVPDRVTGGTFYLYNSGATVDDTVAGVYRSTNDGAGWTKVFNGHVVVNDNFNLKMNSVPGKAGHLFICNGGDGGNTAPLMRSTDGGPTWTNANANLGGVSCFGFGKPLNPGDYPTVFATGFYLGEWGTWISWDNCATFRKIGGALNNTRSYPVWLAGDPLVFGRAHYALGGAGFGTADYGTLITQT